MNKTAQYNIYDARHHANPYILSTTIPNDTYYPRYKNITKWFIERERADLLRETVRVSADPAQGQRA